MGLRHVTPWLLFLLAVLFITPAAFAQADDGGVYNKDGISDGCAGTMNPDVCFHFGDWWYTTWGSWGTSETSCGLSGGCAVCAYNSFGKKVCVFGVSLDASCTCENKPRAGSGPGITDCSPNGSCTYRRNP
jgi:hypothetical protein